MNRKRWTAIVAILTMVVAMISFNNVPAAYAAEDDVSISVTTDKTLVKPGDEVTVSVNLDSFVSTVSGDTSKVLTTMQFELPFDESTFEYVQSSLKGGLIYAVDNAGDYTGSNATVKNGKLTVAVVYSPTTGIKETEEAQALVSFKLKVKDSVSTTVAKTLAVENAFFKNIYLTDAYQCGVTSASFVVGSPEAVVKADATELTVGESVTISAAVENGLGNYTYSYLVYNKDTDSWGKLTGYVSATSYTWKASSAGNREFYVDAKDAYGNVIRSSGVAVVTNEPQDPLTVTATTDASEVVKGSKVTISAIAAGGSEEYTYKYLVYNKDTGVWGNLTSSYVNEASFTWTAGSAGNRELYVEVKDSDGNVTRSNGVAVTVVEPQEPLAVTITADASEVEVGSKVTISAVATGGSESYTYKYLIYNKDTGAWGNLTSSYVSKTSATWTAGSAGNREFYVEVKDSEGNVVRSTGVAVTVVEPQEELAVTVTTNASEVEKGSKVTINAVATGGSESYTYKYLVYNADTKAWGNLTSSYVSASSFTWTAGSTGNREFYVEVKDSEGNVVRSAGVAVAVVEPQKPLTVTATTPESTVVLGSKVTINAAAAGGSEGYTYKFLIYNADTGVWANLTKSYVSTASFTWTAGSTGNREFYVEVKDSEGNVVRSSAVPVTVVTAQKPLAVTATTASDSVLKGSKVTINAVATGGSGEYTYKYLIYNADTDVWANLTSSYVSATSFTWTAGSTGNREFYVEVKDSEGNVVRSSAVAVEVTTAQAELTIAGSANITAAVVGDKVTITGTAAGGEGSYTYSFLVYNKTTNTWARLSTFKASNSFTWTASSEGNRYFYVEVKDATGTVVRSAGVNVVVSAEAEAELSIKASTSASKVTKGTKVTITGTAAGGEGDYTYSYLVYNKTTNTWARLTPSFTSSNTFTWTAGAAGTRLFYVEVKDGSGTVVRSSAVTVVVE